MKGIRNILFFANLFIVSTACYAQSRPGIVVKDPIDVMKSMSLEYKIPSGFEEVRMQECFKSYPKLERIITCAYGQLRSTDQQFFVFTSLFRPLTEGDSVFISKISRNSIKTLDWMHEGNIKANIEESVGKDAAQHWRNYVNYYPADEVRKKYNADSAITYPINLDLQDYYQSKYNHLDVLWVAKKRKGGIVFFYFYTDEGKKHLPDYKKAIGGVIRFK